MVIQDNLGVAGIREPNASDFGWTPYSVWWGRGMELSDSEGLHRRWNKKEIDKRWDVVIEMISRTPPDDWPTQWSVIEQCQECGGPAKRSNLCRFCVPQEASR